MWNLKIHITLRESGSVEKLSVRTVANCEKHGDYSGRKLLYGYGGYPDIAILDENFSKDSDDDMNKGRVYGCVEAKRMSYDLLEFEEKQIININYIGDYFYIKKGKNNKFKYYTILGQIDEKKDITIERKKVDNLYFKRESLYKVKEIVEDITKISFYKKNGDKCEDIVENCEWKEYATENKNGIDSKTIKEYFQGGIYIKIIKDVVEVCDEDNQRLWSNKNPRDIKQLLGELLWYGKVLYTNGKIWKILQITGCEFKEKIMSTVDLRKNDLYKRCIGKESTEIWYNKVDKLTIECKTIGDLTKAFEKQDEKKLNKDDEKEWSELKSNLASIRWKD